MNFVFNSLSKSALEFHIQTFIKLSEQNIEDEYWNREHFSAELSRKWELSFFVTNDLRGIVSFLIASEKKDSVHIHKFVVDKPFQQMGLGSMMLIFLKKKTSKPLTLKVHINNLKAIDFYTRKGFKTISVERDLCLMNMP